MNVLKRFLIRNIPNYFYPRYIINENKCYRKNIKKGMNEAEAKQSLSSNLNQIYDEWADKKAYLLIMKGLKYDLEIPIKYVNGKILSCYYSESSSMGSVMNSKGRNFLRKEIEEYEKLHREKWIGMISVVFGLIGGITGLIAVIKS